MGFTVSPGGNRVVYAGIAGFNSNIVVSGRMNDEKNRYSNIDYCF